VPHGERLGRCPVSTTRYDRLTAAVEAAVKATKRKADLPNAIVDALLDAELTMFNEDITARFSGQERTCRRVYVPRDTRIR
jgi:hypothetical protein